jgi:hypothetical protein
MNILNKLSNILDEFLQEDGWAQNKVSSQNDGGLWYE